MEDNFVVVGTNRLTGIREAVSSPHPFSVATILMDKWKRTPAAKRAYLRLTIRKAVPPPP